MSCPEEAVESLLGDFQNSDNQVPVQSDLTAKSALFEQEIDLDDLQRLPTFIIVLFYAF